MVSKRRFREKCRLRDVEPHTLIDTSHAWPERGRERLTALTNRYAPIALSALSKASCQAWLGFVVWISLIFRKRQQRQAAKAVNLRVIFEPEPPSQPS